MHRFLTWKQWNRKTKLIFVYILLQYRINNKYPTQKELVIITRLSEQQIVTAYKYMENISVLELKNHTEVTGIKFGLAYGIEEDISLENIKYIIEKLTENTKLST